MNYEFNNKYQQLAYQLIKDTNVSFFLTGKAGTGKTTFLRQIQKDVAKNFIVLAPTGIAAINAGGETLHSFFGLPFGVVQFNDICKTNATKMEIIRNADTIIIDEVSMCRCDIIDAIDRAMRKICSTNLAFGGKQIVFVGDIYQLPPVVTRQDTQILQEMYGEGIPFFFKAKVFKRNCLSTIEFEKVYRQEDQRFLGILNNVRSGICKLEDIDVLNTRVRECHDKYVITLCSRNAEADKINQSELEILDSESFTYIANINKEFDPKKYPADVNLTLKVGAQVMMCRNDPSKRWANGSIGIISSLAEDKIEVKFENGSKHIIPKVTWENCNYKYNKDEMKTKKEVTGTFTQYPIRLAWAITIHKSQGLTFSKMNLNLDKGVFLTSQLYVALSRVKSLEGLYLSSPINPSYIKTSQEVCAFARNFNNEQQIQEEYSFSKEIYPLIHKGLYDEAASKCLQLIAKDTQSNNIKGAISKVKTLLNVMISDECLMHQTSSIMANCDNGICAHFVNAVICLYGNRYEEALLFADKVLKQKECKEALYIKSRAYACMEQWEKADCINSLLFQKLDGKFDAKTYYHTSMVNEYHTEDNGMNIMQCLIGHKPSYMRAIISLRNMMQRKGKKLEQNIQDAPLIITEFNSDMTAREFEKRLTSLYKKDGNEYNKLIEAIINVDL